MPLHNLPAATSLTWLLVAVASSGALGCALSAVIVPLLCASITYKQEGQKLGVRSKNLLARGSLWQHSARNKIRSAPAPQESVLLTFHTPTSMRRCALPPAAAVPPLALAASPLQERGQVRLYEAFACPHSELASMLLADC